jgi:DNA-binding LacI/PurR family transcriptional regulator
VARAARVSPSTVSLVLNNRNAGIAFSAATVERVRAAAADLNYRPNAAARSLRTSRTMTVGVIMRDLLHPFSAEFSRAVYAVCLARGYHVLMGNAEYRGNEGSALGDILSPDCVDGILLLGDVFSPAIGHDELEAFVLEHHHVVTVGCRPGHAGEIAIGIDNARGVAMALEYLFKLGHRFVTYVGPTQPPLSWEEEQRWEAYCRIMDSLGLLRSSFDGAFSSGSDLGAARDALQCMLDARTRPTAAFVFNDQTALVLLKAALTMGIRVPDELSVIGFDGLPSGELSTPELTTVCQPIEIMGRHAASVLLDRICGVEPRRPPLEGMSDINPIVFPPTLVRRGSVCPLDVQSSN